MASFQEIQSGLLSLMHRLASTDINTPLPEGTVRWFNRGGADAYIGEDTQVGIYLRITTMGGYGKAARRYRRVTKSVPTLVKGRLEAVPVTVLEHYRESQGFMVLQIQAKSLEPTDDNTAGAWLGRIGDNLEDPSVSCYLRTLGLSVINTGSVLDFPGQVVGDVLSELATLDVKFQVANTVQGPDALPIEHFTGTGHVLGAEDGEEIEVPTRGDKPNES